MEKKSPIPGICSCKVLSMVVLFVFYLNSISAQCSSRMSQPPLQFHVPNFQNEFRRISLSILFGIVTGLVCAFFFALLVRCFIKYINRTPILKGPVVFSLRIPSKTLKSALSNEPMLLGSSPSGKYYKAVLDNGLTVAVKRLELFDDCSPEVQIKATKKKIQQELKVLSCLRHRNLMSLRAYVRESCGYSLVYDYVPTGSLEDVTKRVRENQLQLKWEIRLRIAVGIVKGLHYLHFTCDPTRLHYNLKPSNVIIDAEFKPRLADCGLAAVIPNFCRAASGYNAPECIQNCRYTDKSDVFSFGVILGVLLTGRDPLDPFFGEAGSGGSLGQWLRHLQQVGEAREALDKSILGEEMEEDFILVTIATSEQLFSRINNPKSSASTPKSQRKTVTNIEQKITSNKSMLVNYHRLCKCMRPISCKCRAAWRSHLCVCLIIEADNAPWYWRDQWHFDKVLMHEPWPILFPEDCCISLGNFLKKLIQSWSNGIYFESIDSADTGKHKCELCREKKSTFHKRNLENHQ